MRHNAGMAFEHSLPLKIVRRRRDGVTIECPLREEFLNDTGVLHGGIIASIADEAVWHAMTHHFGKRRPSTTTELKVNYLRPIAGKKVTAKAHLLRAGKRLCVGRVDLVDDAGRLAAVAVVSYMLLDGG